MLESPNLDDRTFDDLVADARRRIERTCPEWTDLSPGDPGLTLVELFAHLTEVMLYRLNRLPEKAYVEFLRLLGVTLLPPAAARVVLRFERTGLPEKLVRIPRGTRVTVSRSVSTGAQPPVFATVRDVTLATGETHAEVTALEGELVEAELAGVATGLPGLAVQARRPPLAAPAGDEFDLVVGVESQPEAADPRVPVLTYGSKTYRLWREVDHFANLGADRHVYISDRMSGRIVFAPAAQRAGPDGRLAERPLALAEVPPAGREIRLWYRRGGGAEGNVARGALTVLKDPIAGVAVTNPERATGGQPAETLDNALVRGPQEIHSLHRAVTARDFELVALQHSRAVARAKALTQADLWAHAPPGTVEILLVPYVPEPERGHGQATEASLRERETDVAREQIQRVIDERRPLGTMATVHWTRYKPVRVQARVVVRREEDPEAVRRRVVDRLHLSINPLPTSLNPTGWPYGQALRASHVYDIALAEPGVLWVDQVRLLVEEVPDREVRALAADRFQPNTWYAGSDTTLYRSLNDGEGWEPIGRFPDESITVVRPHPQRAGYLAVVTSGEEGARLRLSTDCGETWMDEPYTLAFTVEDAAWTEREGVPVLFMAADAGLYELVVRLGSSPVQVLVDPADQDLGFYAVATYRDAQGRVTVATAAQETAGVFLSNEGGKANTFRQIRPQGTDIRLLTVQRDGPRAFLWAGETTIGEGPGSGGFRWALLGTQDPPEGWEAFGAEWQGGAAEASPSQVRTSWPRLREPACSASTWATPSPHGSAPMPARVFPSPTWTAFRQ